MGDNVIVDRRDIIRDGSGDFGCPNCWRENMSRVNPNDSICPKCDEELYWPYDVVEAHRYWVERNQRRGTNGKETEPAT